MERSRLSAGQRRARDEVSNTKAGVVPKGGGGTRCRGGGEK